MCYSHITTFTLTDTSHNHSLIHVTFSIINPNSHRQAPHIHLTHLTRLTHDSFVHPFIHSYPHKHQPEPFARSSIDMNPISSRYRSHINIDIISISIPYQHRYQLRINIIIIILIRRPFIHTTHTAPTHYSEHNTSTRV